MTTTSTIGWEAYYKKVDYLTSVAACASNAYSSVLWLASLYTEPQNCQPLTTAPAYASCLCSKDLSTLLSSASSRCVSQFSCSGTETNEVSLLFSGLCSSATEAVRAIAAGTPATTVASTTAGTTSPTTTTSMTSMLTHTSAGSAPSPTSSESPSSSPGLSTAAIVGIAIGGFIAAIIILSFLTRLFRFSRASHGSPYGSHQGVDEVHMASWKVNGNQPHPQQPYPQQSTPQQYPPNPYGTNEPASPAHRSQTDAIDRWRQEASWYGLGPGTQSVQSSSMAPSQGWSDGSRR